MTDDDEDSKPLTEKEAAFVRAYVGGGCKNATAAARKAGYSPNGADVTGSRLLKRHHIRKAIADAQNAPRQGRTMVAYVKAVAGDDGGGAPPLDGDILEPGEDDPGRMQAEVSEAASLTRAFVITRMMRTLRVCMGEEESEETRVISVKRQDGGLDYTAVQVRVRRTNPGGAVSAGRVLLEECDRLERLAGLKPDEAAATRPAIQHSEAFADALKAFEEKAREIREAKFAEAAREAEARRNQAHTINGAANGRG
jgi:hypothetical protein